VVSPTVTFLTSIFVKYSLAHVSIQFPRCRTMRIISVVSSSYNVAYSVKIGVDCSLQYGSGD
jgi:hypothetical protein